MSENTLNIYCGGLKMAPHLNKLSPVDGAHK